MVEAQVSKRAPASQGLQAVGKALRQIVPAEGIINRLGAFKHEGYKIWPWRYDPTSSRLLHLKADSMDVYEKMSGVTMRSATRWTRVEEDQPREEVGRVCTVREVEHGR